MTQHATGSAPTTSASRYLQQLCKHWSHKAKAEFTPEAGSIQFDSGNHLQMTALPDSLSLSVSVPDDGDLALFQDVVDRHLVRFAFREHLAITWS